MMAIFVITIAAAEVAVGIGLILLCAIAAGNAADVDRYDSSEPAELRASTFPSLPQTHVLTGILWRFGVRTELRRGPDMSAECRSN